MDAALAAIESLKPGESINYTEIAKRFGVNRLTLSRRHRGVQRSREDQYEEQRILNNQQAKDLIKYINGLSDKGLYISHEMLRNFAKELTGKKLGKHWPGRFLKKHYNELASTYTTAMDSNRKRADSAYKYARYFNLLAQKMDQYKVEAENIYNMDEKGFLIGMLSKGLRIFSKKKY
jgi:transposase-like protein